MRRALQFVLVIAALLGLFGQTMAIAASPATTAIETAAPANMPMDCVGMMQGRGATSVPCDRMTLACIFGMGCALLLTLDAGQAVVTARSEEHQSDVQYLISIAYADLRLK